MDAAKEQIRGCERARKDSWKQRVRPYHAILISVVMCVASSEAHVGGGIAVGPDGNVYCVHTKRSQILRISPGGDVTVLASGVLVEGGVQRTHFHFPHHLAMDEGGSVYVADDSGGGLWQIKPNGDASYYWPPKVSWQTLYVGMLGDPFTIDADKNVYVVNHPTTEGPDKAPHPQHAQILRVSQRMKIEVLAGSDRGYADGLKDKAQFGDLFRASLTMGPRGNLYVGEQYSVRLVTPTGMVTTLAGSATPGFRDGLGPKARFDSITGIAVTTGGDVFVADARNRRIRKIAADGIVTTVAGSGERGSIDGPANKASFVWPQGIAVDRFGTLYVIEVTGSKDWGFRVRKVTPEGVVSTLAVIPE